MTTADFRTISSSALLATLPAELVHQILGDSSFTKRDLARCCRVNRNFLGKHYVRNLSLLLRYRLDEDDEDEDDEEDEDEIEDEEDEEDEDQEWPREDSSGFIDCEKILEEALKVMPRVDSLAIDDDIWESQSGGEAVLARGKLWKELSIGGDLFGVHWDSSWSRFPNLTKLQCHALGPQQNSEDALPDQLEVLDTSFSLNLSDPVEVSPGSKLRALRVVLTENKLSHLALMRNLKHLYLVTVPRPGPLPTTILEALSKLSSLQFLSINTIEANPNELDSINALLDHLPPSLTHVHFPEYVPFDSLVTRLQTNKLSHIQALGVGEWYDGMLISLADHQKGMDRLREVCEQKGIAIEEITDPRNIFDV